MIHKGEFIKMFSKILILEDDLLQASELREHINTHLENINVVIATSKQQANELIKNSHNIKAFFLDICLDSKNDVKNTEGLSFAKELSKNIETKDIPIIFITGFVEYIHTAINDIHCFGYLTKPYNQLDVYKLLDDIFAINDEEPFTISFKCLEGIYVRLSSSDIYYVESEGKYMSFHTKNGKLTTRQYRLKELADLLPDHFLHCHKSFIINADFIESVSINPREISLSNIDCKIPYRRDFNYLLL